MGFREMTKEDFKNLPRFGWDNRPVEFDSFVIIPNDKIHDSGYMCMEYCVFNNGEPIGIFGGESDVIHFDGIGGYGLDFEKAVKTRMTDVKSWRVDCLPCGYIRVWCCGCKLIAGGCLSDFEVYTKMKEK